MNVHTTASASTASSFAEDCDFCPKFNEGLGDPILMTHGVPASLLLDRPYACIIAGPLPWFANEVVQQKQKQSEQPHSFSHHV